MKNLLSLAKLALFITNCGMQALSQKHFSLGNATGTNGHMFTEFSKMSKYGCHMSKDFSNLVNSCIHFGHVTKTLPKRIRKGSCDLSS